MGYNPITEVAHLAGKKNGDAICKLLAVGVGVGVGFFAGTILVHKVIEIAYGLSPHSMAHKVSSTRDEFYTEPGTSN